MDKRMKKKEKKKKTIFWKHFSGAIKIDCMNCANRKGGDFHQVWRAQFVFIYFYNTLIGLCWYSIPYQHACT